MPINMVAGANVLGAMITPAVLISASGMLSLATTNRMGRVVDRIRDLSELSETLTAETPARNAEEKRTLIAGLLVVLTRRLQLLHTAVSLLYLSIGILVGTSITLGLTLTLQWDNGLVPAITGICGACCMFVAVLILVVETRIAVQSSLVELDYARRLVERATRVQDVSSAPPPRV